MSDVKSEQLSAAFVDGQDAAEDHLDSRGAGFMERMSVANDPSGKPIPFWKSNPQEFKDFWEGYHDVLRGSEDEVKEISLETVTKFFKEFPHLSEWDKK